MSARELSSAATDEQRATARAEAESIATRWVPAHMTARQGLVDDIAASLINARRLERDICADHVSAVATAFGEAILAYRKKRKTAPQHMFDKFNLFWEVARVLRAGPTQ